MKKERRVLRSLGVLVVAGTLTLLAADFEQYQRFFGLDPVSADGALQADPDSDALSNQQEFIPGTDPLAPDTDRDGWPDNVDSNALSRAVFLWGHPQFTSGDRYLYTFPEWVDCGFNLGGSWSSEGWTAGASLPADTGSLNLQVLRDLLPASVVLDIDLMDSANASLYVALCDTNQQVLVQNLYGQNLLSGSQQRITRRLTIPFSTYPAAASVRLQRGTGDVMIYRCLMYIDQDGDGLDADQELQAGTSDTNPDCDGDGLTDWTELFLTHTNPLVADTDRDGLSDGDEIRLHRTSPLLADSDADGLADGWEVSNGLNPLDSADSLSDPDGDGISTLFEVRHGTVWVDALSFPSITARVGPGQKIQDVIDASGDYAIIFIEPGIYSGWKNQDLKFNGRPMMLKAQPGTVVLEVKGTQAVRVSGTGQGMCTVLDGLIIRNASANALFFNKAGVVLRNCVVENNGGAKVAGGALSISAGPALIENCVFSSNMATNGGAIYAANADLCLRNCTFTKNQVSGKGASIFFGGSANQLTAVNTIFWEETSAPLYLTWNSKKVSISHSCLRGGYAGTNNIALDPQLRGWLIGLNSPCIDAGLASAATLTDLAGHARNGAPDIGAWEYVSETMDSDGDGLSDMQEGDRGLSPLRPDSDGDGLSDGVEVVGSTDPLKADTDTDGLSDGDEVGRSAYAVVIETCTWDEACASAETKGGHLATLSTEKEHLAASASLDGDLLNTISGAWIGASRESVSNEWLWIDGELVEYKKWGWNQPDNNPNERWLYTKGGDFAWFDGEGTRRGYVIEFDNALDPLNPDTDGDGLSDGDEVNLYHTCPVLDDSDFDGVSDWREAPVLSPENQRVGTGELDPSSDQPESLIELDGRQIMASSGAWVVDGGSLYAVSRRGGVEYEAELLQGDIYQLQLSIRQQNTVTPKTPQAYRLRLSVDGCLLDCVDVELIDANVKTVKIYTPFLNAGNHVVQVFWDNYENDLSLRIEQVAFARLPGSDQNNNGVKDWVENRLIARNTIYAMPVESRTSPVCVEGKASYAKAISLPNGIQAVPGPDGTWFGNVDLALDGATHNYEIHFENGGRVLQRELRWLPTNLLTDSLETPIRKGDALLLTAWPEGESGSNGTYRVFVDNVQVLSGNTPQPYVFASTGTFEVRGEYTGPDGAVRSCTVDVEVVGADPEIIAAWVNMSRPWIRPANWPEQATLYMDCQVQQSLDGQGFPQLKTSLAKELYGVLRLGQDGPVLAPVTVKGFNLWFMKNTYLQYDEIYEDGSFKAKTSMIVSPRMPEIQISQRCRGVIAYEDGSRVRDFVLSDFNATGEATIVFCHSSPIATSVCHYTDVYQDGVLIGRSY